MGIRKVYNRFRNTKIIGNTKKTCLILVLAFPLVGCNSETLSQNAKHYQTRAVQVMHVTRDVQFGDENNTYYKLYKHWREENAEERQRAYYQKCLMNLQAQNPSQRLSPGRSNSPVGISQPPSPRASPQRYTGSSNIQEWGVPTSESALPVGTL
jgi:hypothetical protein